MIKTVIKKDLFDRTYKEEIEIDTQFSWAKDYEEDDEGRKNQDRRAIRTRPNVNGEMKKWDKETDQKMPSHMPLCGIQRSGRFVLGIKTDAPIHSYVWTGAFIGGNVRSESSTGRKDHDYQ